MATTGTGTSGTVLRGQGAGATPKYSTAAYPDAAGTIGNVLTSDGNDWLSAASTTQLSPNTVIQLSDDFINCFVQVSPATITGSLGWSMQTTFTSSSALSTAANPGVLSSDTNSAGTVISVYGGVNSVILGSGAISVNWVIRIPTLSAASPRFTIRCGLGAGQLNADQVNGVYFEYSDNLNSGNWVGKTANASTRTSANSAVAVTTSFVNLGITINAAATSVAYFVNGTQIANSPITTNIPTVSLVPFVLLAPIVAASPTGTLLVDLFYMTKTLTTPR